MDVYSLMTIADKMVHVFSSGRVVGETTAFSLEQLSPAQAVSFLMARGWLVYSLGDVWPITYVCKKES